MIHVFLVIIPAHTTLGPAASVIQNSRQPRQQPRLLIRDRGQDLGRGVVIHLTNVADLTMTEVSEGRPEMMTGITGARLHVVMPGISEMKAGITGAHLHVVMVGISGARLHVVMAGITEVQIGAIAVVRGEAVAAGSHNMETVVEGQAQGRIHGNIQGCKN